MAQSAEDARSTDDAPITDRAAKRGLAIALVLGAVLAGLWAVPAYGPLDPSAWNVMGLGMITTVSLYALWILLRAAASGSRSRG